MFIVWRKRPVKGSGGGPFLLGNPQWRNSDTACAWHGLRCEHKGSGRTAWTALVVHSERRDGKPRQKLMFRFPTIRSCCIADQFHRAAWWYDVTRSIEGWSEWAYEDNKTTQLNDDLSRDKASLLEKLREVVPRPNRISAAAFAKFAEDAEVAKDAMYKDALDFHLKKIRERDEERRARGEPEPEDVRFWREMFGRFGKAPEPAPPDAFEVLGLAPGATLAEAKNAHKRLVMVHHPDKGGDEVRFREIQAAFEQVKEDLERQIAG